MHTINFSVELQLYHIIHNHDQRAYNYMHMYVCSRMPQSSVLNIIRRMIVTYLADPNLLDQKENEEMSDITINIYKYMNC